MLEHGNPAYWRQRAEAAEAKVKQLADRLQEADVLLATMGAAKGEPPHGMTWKDVLRIIREAKERHASRPRGRREG